MVVAASGCGDVFQPQGNLNGAKYRDIRKENLCSGPQHWAKGSNSNWTKIQNSQPKQCQRGLETILGMYLNGPARPGLPGRKDILSQWDLPGKIKNEIKKNKK